MTRVLAIFYTCKLTKLLYKTQMCM